MKQFDIALKRCRNNNRSLLAHIRLTARLRESSRIYEMELRDVLRIVYKIIHPKAGVSIREHGSDQTIKSLEICLLRLLKRKADNLSLALSTRIIRIHQTETTICNCLNTVKMIHSCMGQLSRTDSGCLYGLCDERVNIVELCLAQLHIDTAKDINSLRNCLPVKGDIVRNIQIEVAV